MTQRKFRLTAIGLILLSGVFMAVGQLYVQDAHEADRRAEQKRVSSAAEAKFQADKVAVVASIEAKRDRGQFQEALVELEKHARVSSDPVLNQLKISIDSASIQAQKMGCWKTFDDKQAEYKTLLSLNKFQEAAATLKECSELLDSARLREQITAAFAEPYVRTLEDPNMPLDNQRAALNKLREVAPEKVAAYSAQVWKLEAQEAARTVKAERIRKKSEGVRIGMTPEDVYASSWGRPLEVNRTTTQYGAHEQWVYPGHHSYLYFENGILVSIQN